MSVAASPGRSTRALRWAFQVRELGILLALLVLVALFGLLTQTFFTETNLINVVRQVSLLGVMAVGMTFVLVTSEVDLSVGSIYGFSGLLTGVLVLNGWAPALAVVAGLLAGLAIGAFNGAVSAYARIPSFIVTLGTLNAVRGLALILTNGFPITLTGTSVGGLGGLLFLAQGRVFGLSMQTIFFILTAVAGAYLLHRTVLGFRVFAVGGSERAAYIAGVNPPAVKTLSFALLGGLSGLAGILNLAYLESVQPTTGAGLELDVIAAVIIGGTRLGGGEGSIPGTILGVLFIGVLRNGLVLLGVTPFWQTTAIGLAVILAALVDRLLDRRR